MYLIQTVQTTWRPQLPLPKELQQPASDENFDVDSQQSVNDDMDRLHHQHNHHNHHHHQSTSHSNSNKKDNSLNTSQTSNASASNKKWSFGRLFRKKKEIETESSSEEDRKAGFVPVQRNARSTNNLNQKPKTKSSKSSNRSSKLIGAGFDHIVVQPPESTTGRHHHPQQHVENEFFLPVETIPAQEPYYQNQQQQQQYLQEPGQQAFSRSSNSLDRRSARSALKSRSTQRLPHEQGTRSSSEEELISLNSSTFSKYRSDESIHSGGQGNNGQSSRRSRAARNERYYKRLSRDGEVSHGQVPVMYAPQPTQRWKTQPVPLSIYNGPPAPQLQLQQPQQHARHHSQQFVPGQQTTSQRLRNTGSLQHVAPYVQWGQTQQQPKNLQNSVNDSKRSISYDSHIHLQNVNGRMQTKPLPPPPPPRDPMRRVNVNVNGVIQNGSSSDLRPLSYAFDQNGLPILPSSGLKGRCVSDDKIWAAPAPRYQSAHSLNTPLTQHGGQPTQHGGQPTQQVPPPQHTAHSRRFITRADRDAHPGKKSLPNGLDFHYVADATPRSRKPIHMLEQQHEPTMVEPPSSGILRTTKSGLPSPTPKSHASDFWKRLDNGSQRRARDIERAVYAEPIAKPRSISSSRAGELRAYPIPMYSEVYKPNRNPPPPLTKQNSADTVDNVVCGSLHIKAGQDHADNYVEIRHRDYNRSNSTPSQLQQQRRSGEMPHTPNKYEEYVAEKREQHHKPIFNPPTPPQRKLSIPPNAPPIYIPRKKPANLEEAINELEAIYKSLGLSEEPEKKERVPTPSEFEKFAIAHADEYEDEDSPTGEPDPVRDDVAYRNIQLANLQHKTADKQPPFGIPVGPIVPSPATDYLHVVPELLNSKLSHSPDIIKDDMAVRTLRKDPPGPKEKFSYPCGSMPKKNRATRTQSANIYSLIQRDAAKPSGGDFMSYMELARNLDRAGSLSDLHNGDTAADIPTTLTLLRSLKEQEQQQQQIGSPKKMQIPFRHPSQGGAICQLPEKLASPVKEEAQKAPVPLPRKSLTPEPTSANHQMEDALNKIAKDAQESSLKLTQELQELRKEALITASRPKINAEEERLEKDLQEIEAVSEAAKRCGKMLLEALPDANEDVTEAKPRKLHKEGKLIKAIDQVSEAANAVCEKILKDIVTTEPPVVVQEAVKVKNKPQLEPLVMPNLIKKLDPIQSEKIEAIAKRCMRQISELADSPDYDNLTNPELQGAAIATCNTANEEVGEKAQIVEPIISTVAEVRTQPTAAKPVIEEIDQIMQECEAKANSHSGATTTMVETTPAGSVLVLSSADDKTTAPSMTNSSSSSNAAANAAAATSSTTASSFSSSSDCLAKSSSPSASRRQSSSITSFNPYSSSDYIKSPSSDYHALSTDPIKTFSTTSYDVTSTSATPNITTNSTFSYSPSPPLQLTPVSGRSARTAAAGLGSTSEERARSSSPSQYNSSEELAMIFGIEEAPKQQRHKIQPQPADTAAAAAANVSGNATANNTHAQYAPYTPSSSNHASSFVAKPDTILSHTNPCYAACQCIETQATNPACLNVVVVDVDVTTTTTMTMTTTNVASSTENTIATNSPTNVSPSGSCKLETIPELLAEQEEYQEQEVESAEALKLSPNFNKIYASKISIIVDKALAAEGALHVGMTQFDSMSSLEETSSNPDSGNVSLADFPLTGHANVSLQLQTAYNSRFEIRNTFVTEVCIKSGEAVAKDGTGEEFPRLPTEEELMAGLQEEEDSKVSLDDNDFTDTLGESLSDTEIEASAVESELDGIEQGIRKTQERKVISLAEAESDESFASTSLGSEEGNDSAWGATKNLTKEADLVALKRTFDISQALEDDETSYSFTEDYSSLHRNLNECDAMSSNETSLTPLGTPPARKRSIVYETPQINMNISEVKLSYEELKQAPTEDDNETHANILTQISQCTAEVEKLNEALQQMPRRRSGKAQRDDAANDDDDDDEPDAAAVTEMNAERRLLPWQQPTVLHAAANSQQADVDAAKSANNSLSLLGELRAANSLTILEHVLVACSLGVISTNDLFTLFLIIIGVITIIAIVLF